MVLRADSDDERIVVTVLPGERPEVLEGLLRDTVRGRPTKFGLIDADVGLDGLLRALWKFEHSREPWPGEIPAR